MRLNRQRAEEASTPDRTSQPLTSRGVDGAQPASDVPADRGGFDRADVAHFPTDAGSIDPVAIGDPGRGVGVTRRSDVTGHDQAASSCAAAGELLVQYRLVKLGIDSARLTDSGVDLVAYSPGATTAVTIQVKTQATPTPSGGKGALSVGSFPRRPPRGAARSHPALHGRRVAVHAQRGPQPRATVQLQRRPPALLVHAAKTTTCRRSGAAARWGYGPIPPRAASIGSPRGHHPQSKGTSFPGDSPALIAAASEEDD